MPPQLRRMCDLAERLIEGKCAGVAGLSTGERIFVALAANRTELLDGWTIAEALNRLSEFEVKSLIVHFGDRTSRFRWRDVEDREER